MTTKKTSTNSADLERELRNPTPKPRTQAQILSELEATLQALLSAIQTTLTVKQESKIEQQQLVKLLQKIERSNNNSSGQSQLLTAIEKLTEQIQTHPQTEQSEILNLLKDLKPLVSNIPTSTILKSDLSPLATQELTEQPIQQIQRKQQIMFRLIWIVPIILSGIFWILMVNMKTEMIQKIQQVPQAIENQRNQLKLNPVNPKPKSNKSKKKAQR